MIPTSAYHKVKLGGIDSISVVVALHTVFTVRTAL